MRHSYRRTHKISDLALRPIKDMHLYMLEDEVDGICRAPNGAGSPHIAPLTITNVHLWFKKRLWRWPRRGLSVTFTFAPQAVDLAARQCECKVVSHSFLPWAPCRSLWHIRRRLPIKDMHHASTAPVLERGKASHLSRAFTFATARQSRYLLGGWQLYETGHQKRSPLVHRHAQSAKFSEIAKCIPHRVSDSPRTILDATHHKRSPFIRKSRRCVAAPDSPASTRPARPITTMHLYRKYVRYAGPLISKCYERYAVSDSIRRTRERGLSRTCTWRGLWPCWGCSTACAATTTVPGPITFIHLCVKVVRLTLAPFGKQASRYRHGCDDTEVAAVLLAHQYRPAAQAERDISTALRRASTLVTIGCTWAHTPDIALSPIKTMHHKVCYQRRISPVLR